MSWPHFAETEERRDAAAFPHVGPATESLPAHILHWAQTWPRVFAKHHIMLLVQGTKLPQVIRTLISAVVFPTCYTKYKFGWLLIVFYEKRKKFGGQLILEITRFDKVKQLLSIAVMCASSLSAVSEAV